MPLSPDGTATPLFCVHASSGSAYSYLELARLLGADQPVYGIEAPGFDGDREPVRSLHALSAEYAETLREFQPDGDFLLLGWSLGGVIAFDMARRLTAAGARVRQVIMIDVSVPRVAELPPEKEIARRFLRDMLSAVGAPPTALDRVLAGQPDEATSEAIFLAAESSGALPAELDADLLAERYAVFRAHVEASFGFEVTEPHHGRVVHLIASESPLQYMRWDKVATGLTEHVVPGSHHSIWTGNSLLRLAGLTRAALAGAD
ncbi:alpha/beta fold hydrolase [Streptomyces sp.]|uniref:thioesterase domain-containing protein n=1 Tax=Streptomyces sp. TaxID=1931 RepID=UPI002F41A00A